ncbi:MAG: hypothetical protein ABFE07_12050 [Armatimonadia bacterium]
MKVCFLAFVLLLLPLLAGAEPEVLVDTDFGSPGKVFEDLKPEAGNRITGALPEGWSDNTGWRKNTVIEYQPLEEAGRKFVRVLQKSGGGAQFTHGLPGVEKTAGYYRLTLTARSVTGGSFALRFVGAPYATVWEATPGLTDQWQDFSYDLRVSAQPQEIALYVYLAADGSMDLQKLKLVKLSEADLIAELKTKYPEAAQGNLVRVSRFPLGLQSGWSIDRDYSDGDQVRVVSDQQVLGPSGAPALRIEAPEGVKLYTAPFAVPWSFEQHVASLSVRGDWEGKLVVVGGKVEQRAEKALKLSGTEWQRVELPFKPVLMANCHGLRIEGKGTLWIDAMQVERGAVATAYAPQTPLEVSLALPGSEASAARVQFADEPAAVRYCVTGKAPGALLKTRLVHVSGEEKLLPPVKLGEGFLNSGTLRYEPFIAYPFGTYRLEAWVEDAAGKRLSTYNELVLQRLRRPRYWGKDAPNSGFGTHTLSTTRHLLMAKAVGSNWVRLHDAGTEYIGWAHLEREQGQWQFRDEALQRYRRHHLKILGLLSTAPGWATNWGKPTTGYFERYMEPKNFADFGNYVRVVTARYRGVIDSYEVWNEPWGSAFWSLTFDPKAGASYTAHFVPSETPSADYARLQETAFKAAHAVDPKLTIVGFNTYGSDSGRKWTQDLVGFGALDTCDVISYHHYSSDLMGSPDDSGGKAYNYAVGPIIDKLGRVPKPVWMSEGDPQAGATGDGFYKYTLPYENKEDVWRLSDRLACYVLSQRATGEAKTFLYTMHGHSFFGGSSQWTVFVTSDGYPHPNAAAHSTIAWLLEDTKFVKVCPLADGIYAYLFSGPGRAVAVISRASGKTEWKLPRDKGVELIDLFGNPLPAGSALGSTLTYLNSDDMSKLQKALALKR